MECFVSQSLSPEAINAALWQIIRRPSDLPATFRGSVHWGLFCLSVFLTFTCLLTDSFSSCLCVCYDGFSHLYACADACWELFLTFTDRSVVTPGCEDFSHSLAADGFTALKNIVFSASELHHTFNAKNTHRHKQREGSRNWKRGPNTYMYFMCRRACINTKMAFKVPGCMSVHASCTWNHCHGVFHSLALPGQGRSLMRVSLHLHSLQRKTDRWRAINIQVRIRQSRATLPLSLKCQRFFILLYRSTLNAIRTFQALHF